MSEDRRVGGRYEDLPALPDDGLRHERIGGEHIVSPSRGSVPQLIVGDLHRLLGSFLRDHPIGVAMLAPFDIVFSRHDVLDAASICFSVSIFELP